ncbi:hypothetical protein, partial [Streptomyces capuensis]|uniref:hypothetical protein n=1 Tax=Streptomyces capuensis TaxID=1464056 RepID=UPI0004BF08BC
MGKRQRRRSREKAKAAAQRKQHAAEARKADIVQYPAIGTPLLQVEIADSTPTDIRALCLAYWEFEEPGTWARNVSSIGSTSYVYAAVKEACTASLLTVVCPDCASSVTVSSRSEMAATGFWKPNAMPDAPMTSPAPCSDCQKAQKAASAQEAAAEKARLDKQQERRRNNASEWLGGHRRHTSWDDEPTLTGALVLLAMADIMEKNDTGSVGPLSKVSYTFTGSRDDDIQVLRELHCDHWIAPTTPATIGDFAYNDDDTVSGVYLEPVPWRLAYWAGDNT